MTLGLGYIKHESVTIPVQPGSLMIAHLPGTHLCKKLLHCLKEFKVFQAFAFKVASTIGHNVAEYPFAISNLFLLWCVLLSRIKAG
jgi:hypothetical protein